MARPARALGAVLLTAALVLVTACSSDGEEEPSGPTVAPSVIPPQTATSEAPAATTTTAPEPIGLADAAHAAQAFYDAWVAGDRAAAGIIAEPAAVDGIWAAVPGPYELYRGCDTGEFDTGGCLFRDRSTNHTIQVELTRRKGLWVVTGAFYSEA